MQTSTPKLACWVVVLGCPSLTYIARWMDRPADYPLTDVTLLSDAELSLSSGFSAWVAVTRRWSLG